MSWMISSGVSLSRCALVSAAAQAIRPGSAEPTRATAPPTPATLRNARRPSRSGLCMLILLDRALLLTLESRAYGAALRLRGILNHRPIYTSVAVQEIAGTRTSAIQEGLRDFPASLAPPGSDGASSRLVPAFSPQS